MLNEPQGQRSPVDVIGSAVMITKIVTDKLLHNQNHIMKVWGGLDGR